jgi:hypothetical protein
MFLEYLFGGKKTPKIETFEDAMKQLRQINSTTAKEEKIPELTQEEISKKRFDEFLAEIVKEIKSNTISSTKSIRPGFPLRVYIYLNHFRIDNCTCLNKEFFERINENLQNTFIGWDSQFRFNITKDFQGCPSVLDWVIVLEITYQFNCFENLCGDLKDELVTIDCALKGISLGMTFGEIESKVNEE